MLRISYSRQARKAIEGYPDKHRRRIGQAVERLRTDPAPHDAEPLKGKLRPFLPFDVGEYRVIYRVEEDVLLIAAVGRRNDDAIYREFERARKG